MTNAQALKRLKRAQRDLLAVVEHLSMNMDVVVCVLQDRIEATSEALRMAIGMAEDVME